ncbi:MAG TPA: BamA/TamA family outer membrane protein [Terriglobales bacterium]|nr:BamA/TamA family outer membrane protein [Terriglobales bacterium]
MPLRALLPLLSLLIPALAAAAPEDLTRYRISASLDTAAAQLTGRARIVFRNHSSQPLAHIPLVLFANRFADEEHDTGVNDFNRPFVYPYQDYDAGWSKLESVVAAGSRLAVRPATALNVPQGSIVLIDLAQALAPGGEIELDTSFTTQMPNRFGSFGHFDEQITAVGGWHPYLPALSADGRWQLEHAPPLALFEVELRADRPRHLALNGHLSGGPVSTFRAEIPSARYLSLIASPDFEREEISAAGGRAVLLYRDHGWWYTRIALGPSHAEIRRDAIERLLATRTAASSDDPLILVEAPLRMHLTAPGEGMVVLSDRALRVHWLLRGFHQMELAEAVYRERLRTDRDWREPDGDAVWVAEGIAHELARRDEDAAPKPERTVQDWIELFNVFAVVDRFETAPKIPFVEAYFAKMTLNDPLREQILTFQQSLPSGEVLFEKLRQRLGEVSFTALIDTCNRSPLPFRRCAAERDLSLAEFFEQWVAPLPQLNYRIAQRSLNQPAGDGFRHQVGIERQSNRLVEEPVEVAFDDGSDAPPRARWQGAGDRGMVEAHTAEPVDRAVIDPDRRLIEATRVDNASPPIRQILLDTAEIEVSSTEFSLAGTLVARSRYDYRKDLALTGFYTNRSVGLTFGPRYHWGTQNDENSYRHNLYGFYGFQWLDRDFDDDSRPGLSTDGHVNGAGLRYDYNDIFAYDNPTRSTHIRLFADIWHAALGSDFDFADWGGSIGVTQPLWSYRTLLAGEVFNGFSTAIGNSTVPNQSRYSLGGSRSIRGIGAEDKLGRNIFIVRAELRQAIYPEFDHNLMDFLILRRGQVRLFSDAGEVDSSSGDIYDPRRFAVGVGVGVGVVYEFMGMYPATMYLEVATRVDRRDDLGEIQILFGTRQAF